jgi:site-specific recombinase
MAALVQLDLLGKGSADVGPGLQEAVQVLAHQIGGLGMRPEVADRMHWLEAGTSPFLDLSGQALAQVGGSADALPLAQVLETLVRCRSAVVRVRDEKHTYGTSLKLTALTHRLLQLIDRLELLLLLTDPDSPRCARSVVRLSRALVRAECTRNSLLRHAQESADLLLFRVVEHAAYKGRKFITTTRSEYWRFLVSSLGGGLIVGVFALFKVLIDQMDLSQGVEALGFSANYALCFILIHLTGSTLATKQPAVTAHALAHCLEGTGDRRHLDQLLDTITRVWRTQFISFVGNLVAAFPMGFAVAELYRRTVGTAPAYGAKAEGLLADLHPWASGSLFYAAIAGVFLFSAGLVSGWVDNSSNYSRVPERVAGHPVLIALGGKRFAGWVSRFVERHLGAVVGNAWLGLCLGAAGTFGAFFGLPFDIRHIAFASAHFAMAVEGLDYAVPASAIVLTTLSVSAIGFVNFLVSFSLALFLAVESRQITFNETRRLVARLSERMRRRPLDFFYPPGRRGPQRPRAQGLHDS